MGGMIVTGAFGTLGRAVIDRLAREGLGVAAIDLAGGVAEAADLSLGGVDLTDEVAVAASFAQAADRFGGIVGLANVVGGFVWEKVDGGTVATWERMQRINLATALLSARAVLPHMRRGAIVNVGAASAASPGVGMGAYAASKAGVLALTRSLAAEVRDRGIRVNAVLPTIIDTPQNRGDMPDADKSDWVRPEAAAEVIAFLLSDRSACVTGAEIPLSLRG